YFGGSPFVPVGVPNRDDRRSTAGWTSAAAIEDQPGAVGVRLGEAGGDGNGGVRVFEVEDVVAFDFDACRVHVGAFFDLLRFGAHDQARASFEVEREQGDWGVVGHSHGPALQVDRLAFHERQQVALDAF